MKIKKCSISSGHNVYLNSSFDCGAVGNGKRESDLAKATVAELIKILNMNGIVIQDVTPYNQKFTGGSSKQASRKAHVYRCNLVDKFGSDIFLDIHLNSGGGTGVECWVYDNKGISSEIGKKICDNISKTFGIRNRGVKTNPEYWSLSLCKAQAIIVECAFMDSANDMRKFNPNKCAIAIAEGIIGRKISAKPQIPKAAKKTYSIKYCLEWQKFYNAITKTKAPLRESNACDEATKKSFTNLLPYIKQCKKYNYCLEFQRFYNRVTKTKAPIDESGYFCPHTEKAFNNMIRLVEGIY